MDPASREQSTVLEVSGTDNGEVGLQFRCRGVASVKQGFPFTALEDSNARKVDQLQREST